MFVAVGRTVAVAVGVDVGTDVGVKLGVDVGVDVGSGVRVGLRAAGADAYAGLLTSTADAMSVSPTVIAVKREKTETTERFIFVLLGLMIFHDKEIYHLYVMEIGFIRL